VAKHNLVSSLPSTCFSLT